ncbi:MAG: hypothetical protein ACRDF4_07135 [Rhabdochlamydiaceae bacterium]
MTTVIELNKITAPVSKNSPKRSKLWRVKAAAGHAGRMHEPEFCDLCQWLAKIKPNWQGYYWS